MGRNNTLRPGSKNLNLENWKVYHPSGRHMFTCGERRANWYLDRDLARHIGKRVGSKMIELTFLPKGNGFEDDEEFGKNSREAKCVVTGKSYDLQRHHIVPSCYRTYFPEIFKSKNHHDVVLMNHDAHSEYEQKANEFKDEIANIYGVKTIRELNKEYTAKLHEVGKANAILINAIHLLFRTHGKITTEAKMQKLKFIADNTNIPFETFCTYNYLQIYKIYLFLQVIHENEMYDFKEEHRRFYDHGYHVAQKLNSEEKIAEFVKLWRNHFIDTMHPLFMPNGWSIDFRIKTNMQ